jgi:lysophospholipase L1-like esterase
MAFSNFPYTDFHNLNLDWLLGTVKALEATWEHYNEEWDKWQKDVQNYIDNLDYIAAIDKYLDDLKNSGELSNIIDTWLTEYGLITIGDSYGEGYTPDGTVKSWCDILHERYFSNASFYVNKSKGGSGFAANTPFSELLTAAVASLTDQQKKLVKYVVIAGGWNDQFEQTSAIIKGITEVETIMHSLPNATLYIGWIATPIVSKYPKLTAQKAYEAAKAVYVTSWNRYKYLSGADSALRWGSVLSSDNIHPNANGQHSIADMVYKAMNGYATWNRSMDAYITGVECSLSIGTMHLDITNDNAHCSVGNVIKMLGMTFKSAKNFTSKSVIVMHHNITFVNEQSICNCNAILHDSNGWHQCFAVLTINPYDDTQIDTGSIYLQLIDVSGDGYKTFTSVDQIQLYGVEFNIPLH